MDADPPHPASPEPAPFTHHLLALHEASPQLLAVFDEHDVLRFANPAFCQAFDVHPDGHTTWLDMMRRNLASGRGSKVNATDPEAWLAGAASRRGKQPFRAFEADLIDGHWIWMTEAMDAQGWMFCCASDISPLKIDGRTLRQERDRALRAAQTDAMTGISNRAHVLQQMQEQLRRVQIGAGQMAVVLLDLDHFKRINDSLGHAAGDAVICDFARQLQACSRRADACGRMGGEEFALLLVDVSAEQAQAVVERLLASTRQASPVPEQASLRYTASAGLTLARPEDCVAALCHRADEALYQAKAAGRDRWMWAG